MLGARSPPVAAGGRLQGRCSCLRAKTCHVLIQVQHVPCARVAHRFLKKSAQVVTCHTQNFPEPILLHLTLNLTVLLLHD